MVVFKKECGRLRSPSEEPHSAGQRVACRESFGPPAGKASRELHRTLGWR